MKSTSAKIMLVILSILGLFLLSSCTANIITDLKSDGSGNFTQEYIMNADELSSAGITAGQDLCTDKMGLDLSEMPPSTTVRQEQTGEEYHCYFESSFATVEELQTIYTDFLDSTVNDLRIEDGKFYYDVTINMGEGGDTSGFLVFWIVKMPGSITEHNATEKDGNTLTWALPSTGEMNASATGKLGGLNISNATWYWVIGIGAACLCLVVVAAVIVLIIVLVRRNKKKGTIPQVPPAPISQ